MTTTHLRTAAYSAPIITAIAALIADADPALIAILALAWLWAEVRSLIHHADADRWRVLADDRLLRLVAAEAEVDNLRAGQLTVAPVYDILSWRGGES